MPLAQAIDIDHLGKQPQIEVRTPRPAMTGNISG
jgi:hypothetical protein